jgi:twitching motility protein PilT
MEITQMLEIAVNKKASDLHLIVGTPPMLRVDGVILPVPGETMLTAERAKELIFSLVNEEQKEILLVNRELDFSFAYGEKGRFRVNAYHQMGCLSAALRLIPSRIPTIDELFLPKICHQFAQLRQGFVLVTGPTGHGKSTTLAAVIDEINQNRREHIITIEDPIEYVFPPQESIISQRELKADTHSWEIALRSVLREDPNVVMVGEMRDYETIAAALTVAETGHLVFATLHTNSAAQTIDRIVDVFPPHQQDQVKMQLSLTLEAVFSQRLLPSIKGGRVVAAEVMVATPAVKTAIREGKVHLLDNIIQTSAELGMRSLEMDLADLVKAGKISLEVAKGFALRPADLMRQARGK